MTSQAWGQDDLTLAKFFIRARMYRNKVDESIKTMVVVHDFLTSQVTKLNKVDQEKKSENWKKMLTIFSPVFANHLLLYVWNSSGIKPLIT